MSPKDWRTSAHNHRRDFAVLDPLSRRDQARVTSFVFEVFLFNHFFAFFYQAFHTLAFFAGGLFT